MKPRFSIGAADRSGNSWQHGMPYTSLRIAQLAAEDARKARPDWCVFITDEEEPERGDLSDADPEEYHERWGIR